MSAVAAPHAPTQTPPPVRGPVPTAGFVPHRWTVHSYRELAKTGLFHDVKTALIHGELFTMTMPGPHHDAVMSVAHALLQSICPVGYYVRNQQGLDIGTDNNPGPDLAIVSGTPLDHIKKTPTSAALVAEVADSTLFLDTTTKAELYATAGVPEYWVLDLEHRQLIVFRDPRALPKGAGPGCAAERFVPPSPVGNRATAYKAHLTLGPSERVSPLLAPQASVLVGELLP